MVPLGTTHDGAVAVSELLCSLFAAFPDLTLEVTALYHSDNAVISEVRMHATHCGPWAGMEATGKRINLPVVGIFLFEDDRMVCERLYYDSATLLRQMAVGV